MTLAETQFEDEKAKLRLKAFEQRAAIARADRPDMSKAAARNFLKDVPIGKDQIIALYWPIRDEIDCKPLLTALMDSGQPICLPVVLGDGEPLEMRLWEQGQPLYPSGFGTLAPSDGAPVVEPDIVVIPLLAFDRLGTRLGYGKGYYDRTLAILSSKPLLVGYAFSGQELDFIPREAHDMPLDILVTEEGVRKFPAA